MTTTQITDSIPCGACNGAEFTGSGYSDADHCSACSNGLAICYCGELAVAVECGDPVCGEHADGDAADLTARIPVESMRQVVFGQEVA